tara:strand:- start:863 stop:1717 length:855 start_codon:yes stop_codon:yes gene_type:complete
MAKNKKRNRQKLLAKKYKSGNKISRKEVNQIAKKLNIKPGKARKISQKYSKKQGGSQTSLNPFKITNSFTQNSGGGNKQASINPFKVSNFFNQPSGRTDRHPPMANLPAYKPTKPKNNNSNQLPSLDVPDMQDHIDTSQANNQIKNDKKIGKIEDTGEVDTIGGGVDSLSEATTAGIESDAMRYDDSAYMKTINNLLTDLTSYQTKANTYSTELGSLSKKFEDFKGEGSKTFRDNKLRMLGSNSASGVRFKRSKNRGLFALGTGQFNRANRDKNASLKLGNVNL